MYVRLKVAVLWKREVGVGWEELCGGKILWQIVNMHGLERADSGEASVEDREVANLGRRVGACSISFACSWRVY
jgi:hypothetical protein